VSEQKTEPTSAESASHSAGPAASAPVEASTSPVTAQETVADPVQETASTDAPALVPEQGPVKVEAPAIEIPESAKTEATKPESAKAESPRPSGKIMIMAPDARGWGHAEPGAEPEIQPEVTAPGKRRIAALAAVVALAALTGALGGALATVGITHFAGDTAATGNPALEAAVARIDADILALKTSVDHTTKVGMNQFSKTSERLDKVEKAQAEPAAKLAKLNDAVEKLRSTPAAAAAPMAAAPAAAKETTGSIAPQSTAVAPPAAAVPKVEVARLPTVDGWMLRDVGNGGALIESRRGVFEVYAGDYIPGLGRIDAVRKQDGRWVVVTARGLIVAR
jgi:hypothetical protein